MTNIVRTMYTPPDANGNAVPHPADYHAEITAEKIIGELESSIISIGATAPNETILAGRALRKAIELEIIKHHEKVHSHEQGKLAEHGLARLEQGHTVSNPEGTVVVPDSREVLGTDDEEALY